MRRLKNGGRCGIVLPEGQILFGGGAFQAIREELLQKFNVTAIISLPQGAFAQMGAGVKTNLVFFEKTGSTKEIWYGEMEGKFTKTKVVQDNHLVDIFEKLKKREVTNNSWIIKIADIANKDFDLSPKNPLKILVEDNRAPKEVLAIINKLNAEINELTSGLEKIL